MKGLFIVLMTFVVIVYSVGNLGTLCMWIFGDCRDSRCRLTTEALKDGSDTRIEFLGCCFFFSWLLLLTLVYDKMPVIKKAIDWLGADEF